MAKTPSEIARDAYDATNKAVRTVGVSVPAASSSSLPAQGTNVAAAVAEALVGAASPCSEVIVQADPDNTEDLFVGNSAGQPLQLKPGDSISIQVADANLVFIQSAGGTAVANYLTRS